MRASEAARLSTLPANLKEKKARAVSAWREQMGRWAGTLLYAVTTRGWRR